MLPITAPIAVLLHALEATLPLPTNPSHLDSIAVAYTCNMT